MTEDEWAAFRELLANTFIGDLDAAAEAPLREYFGGVRLQDAKACVTRLVAQGAKYMPKPPELVAELAVVRRDAPRRLALQGFSPQDVTDHFHTLAATACARIAGGHRRTEGLPMRAADTTTEGENHADHRTTQP